MHRRSRRSEKFPARWPFVLVILAIVATTLACSDAPSSWPGFIDPPDGFAVQPQPDVQSACGPFTLVPDSTITDPFEALMSWVTTESHFKTTENATLVDGTRRREIDGGWEAGELDGGDQVPLRVIFEGSKITVGFCSG